MTQNTIMEYVLLLSVSLWTSTHIVLIVVYHLLSNTKLLDTNWKQKFLVCGVIGYP